MHPQKKKLENWETSFPINAWFTEKRDLSPDQKANELTVGLRLDRPLFVLLACSKSPETAADAVACYRLCFANLQFICYSQNRQTQFLVIWACLSLPLYLDRWERQKLNC